jgi:hypothetical protein
MLITTRSKFFFLSIIGPMVLLSPVKAKTLISTDTVPVMLEVYSSQGCSSCPPAEAWLNNFKSDPRLWKTIVPINFHVDYWDYLGWPDPYANSEFSLRQRDYKQAKHTKTVATPGFVVDGKGWNGWFAGKTVSINQRIAPGELTAEIDHQMVKVSYRSKTPEEQRITATIALLGFGQETYIGKGENQGRKLKHDFIVLNHNNQTLNLQNGRYQASMSLPDVSDFTSTKTAVVIWVSQGMDPKPIQVVADWQ